MADVITVTVLNRYVKEVLEKDAVLADVGIRGEITNFVNHRSGHFYFSLRDEACSVPAVMFRSYAQALPFLPENGMRVIVRGRVSLYERDGKFQLYVDAMFPDGAGVMQMAFDQLKAKLEREGLFAQEHKKPLPAIPHCVGLVTSKTGAAIQDILNVTKRRFPMARFLLCNTTVQGSSAAPGIAHAIASLDDEPEVDVILIARGGGSREDLWVFNDERIARAAYACKKPVVSAVGHEIDYSILDYVADLRAPTPSAAAELIMPDAAALYGNACQTFMNIHKTIQNMQQIWYNKWNEYFSAPQLAAVRQMSAQKQEALAMQSAEIQSTQGALIARAKQGLLHRVQLCESLSPYHVLARGYSITKNDAGVVKDAAQARVGTHVQVTLAHGTLGCTVDTCETGEAT